MKYRAKGGFADGTLYLESDNYGEVWLIHKTNKPVIVSHAYTVEYCEHKVNQGKWEILEEDDEHIQTIQPQDR